MQFKMKADEETLFEVLAAEAEKDFDPIDLVYPARCLTLIGTTNSSQKSWCAKVSPKACSTSRA